MFEASNPRVDSSIAQDYLKAIHGLAEATGDEAVSTGALAERLGVSPGTASAMARRLAERGLVAHVPYHGVSLTSEGRTAALAMVRRHRLLESFLAQELGVPWERVHAEAEVLEHALSDELEAAIAAKLGDPDRDPHGDPIPSAELELREPATRCLDELEAGSRGTVARVSDAEPGILRYLSDREIAPGDRIEVLERQPFGGPLIVRVGGRSHALGGEVAAAMRVALEPAATEQRA